jgi:transcriptional regulator with XRE-family HTH domain
MSSEFKSNKSAIEWRRNMVMQRLSQGFSQSDIAKELKLHPSTISLDCQYLRLKAREDMQLHIEERIPIQYEQCHIGYKMIMRKAYEISNDTHSKTSEVLDSLRLMSDTYDKLMNLSTDPQTLKAAIEWIEKKKESLYQQQSQELTEEEENSICSNEQNPISSDKQIGEEQEQEQNVS